MEEFADVLGGLVFATPFLPTDRATLARIQFRDIAAFSIATIAAVECTQPIHHACGVPALAIVHNWCAFIVKYQVTARTPVVHPMTVR